MRCAPAGVKVPPPHVSVCPAFIKLATRQFFKSLHQLYRQRRISRCANFSERIELRHVGVTDQCGEHSRHTGEVTDSMITDVAQHGIGVELTCKCISAPMATGNSMSQTMAKT